MTTQQEAQARWDELAGAVPALAWSKSRRHDPCVVTRPDMVRVADTARVDAFCKLEGGLSLLIGAHVHVASFCHLGAGGGLTIVEDGATCASHVTLCSGASEYGDGRSGSAVHPDFRARRGFVWLERNVIVFAGAVILPGVRIGRGAVVAAGSVVRQDVAHHALVAGNPARVVRNLPWAERLDGTPILDRELLEMRR